MGIDPITHQPLQAEVESTISSDDSQNDALLVNNSETPVIGPHKVLLPPCSSGGGASSSNAAQSIEKVNTDTWEQGFGDIFDLLGDLNCFKFDSLLSI